MRTVYIPIFLLFLTACRKELSDNCNPSEQRVEVNIVDLLPDHLDSFGDLTLRSFNICLYPLSNNETITKNLNGADGVFTIPYGAYSVLIYSSDFFDLDANFYRGTNNSNTYEAYSRQYTQNGILFVEEPDPLFCVYIENFAVDESFEFLPITLIPRVFTYRFKIQVEGIEHITSASARITGMYTSAYLKDGRHREEEEATMKTGLTKTNTTNTTGYLYGEFRSYGSHQRPDIRHKITIILNNGQTKEVELEDLTTAIKSLHNGGEIIINQKIIITPGEGGGGGGNEYNPEVNPWDDLEISLAL